MTVFALAACGNNETLSGSEGNNPGISQTDNQGGSENQVGEGCHITILNEDHNVAIVPTGLKKAWVLRIWHRFICVIPARMKSKKAHTLNKVSVYVNDTQTNITLMPA